MKMHISYQKRNHSVYATASRSVRHGASVDKSHQIYLGKVLDKEKKIFQNRKMGIFTYDPDTNSFGKAPVDFVPPHEKHRKTKLHLDFGDSFFIWSFIQSQPVKNAVEAIGYGNMDSLWALLFFYMICDAACCHAFTWAEGNFVRCLFPRANLTSQKISELLHAIGDEYSYRHFFEEYLHELRGSGQSEGSNILIDSTGLPNSVRFPLTAVNTHNGHTEEEVRLIYVTHQETGLPIYFRYVAGNIVDVSTLERTIAHLKTNGVNVKFSILDAGYYSETNLKTLKDEKISFLMRVRPNYKLYKDIFNAHRDSLETKENGVLHKGRLLYIKRIECEPLPGYRCFAYLGLDTSERSAVLKSRASQASQKGKTASELIEEMENQGYFILLSSRRIAVDKLLPLYYTRDRIEKVFCLGKTHANFLPVRVESEEAFRGHLLMTFIAAAILKQMENALSKSDFNLISAFMELRNQKCSVYENYVITDEPVKKARKLYELIGIDRCPAEIEFPPCR